MSLAKLRAVATYDANSSDAEIDTFREQQLAYADTNDLSGYFVLGEGDSWIMLEGDSDDIRAAAHDLGSDSFFTDYAIEEETSISARKLDKVYLYNEGRTPITSDDLP